MLRVLIYIVASLFMLAISVLFSARIFLKPFQVTSNGMAPSIIKHEKFVVDKLLFRDPSDLKYGDILVYWGKNRKYVFIWRLIGKPGDKVSIKNGIPIVNQKEVSLKEVPCPKADELIGFKCYEETLFNKTYKIAFKPVSSSSKTEEKLNVEEFEVPDNSFFLLGDCRNCAYDNRFTGFVGYDQIIGKALFFYHGRIHRFGESL